MKFTYKLYLIRSANDDEHFLCLQLLLDNKRLLLLHEREVFISIKHSFYVTLSEKCVTIPNFYDKCYKVIVFGVLATLDRIFIIGIFYNVFTTRKVPRQILTWELLFLCIWHPSEKCTYYIFLLYNKFSCAFYWISIFFDV